MMHSIVSVCGDAKWYMWSTPHSLKKNRSKSTVGKAHARTLDLHVDMDCTFIQFVNSIEPSKSMHRTYVLDKLILILFFIHLPYCLVTHQYFLFQIKYKDLLRRVKNPPPCPHLFSNVKHHQIILMLYMCRLLLPVIINNGHKNYWRYIHGENHINQAYMKAIFLRIWIIKSMLISLNKEMRFQLQNCCKNPV